ncbi:MAG: glycosyltransferase family 2 protein [Algibacter sp.]
MNFSVSVIIPVYNAELFIEKAILSVLYQNEVEEVIVVNDGSKDNTVSIIEKLKGKDNRIQIFHHNNRRNKGRSASRNLGIKNATKNFIAFLDADDFYLKNRFKNDKIVFESNLLIDGVYNAIGVHFYREYSRDEQLKLKLTTVTEKIESSVLFNELLSGKKGYFSIDGLTIKKDVFNKTGYFVEHLKIAEDTDLILKMALKSKLEAGIINKPVALRGVHDNNVFNDELLYRKSRDKMYEALIYWCFKKGESLKVIDELLKWLFYYRLKEKHSNLKETSYWFYLLKKNPKLIGSYLALKYFPIIRKRKNICPFLFK